MAMPPREVVDRINNVQQARGWIISSYSQIEYFLGDIITKSMEMPEYADIDGRLPHGASKRIRRVRQILKKEGFYSQFSKEIAEVIDEFSAHQDVRNLLAHGYADVQHDANNNILCTFRKWHRNQENEDVELVETFFPIHLAYVSEQMKQLSQRSLTVFRATHDALGLVGND